MSRCLYRTLNVARDASEKQIKLSYRKLALSLHPDVNGGDSTKTARFREVHHAYEILSDKVKRNEYDSNGTSSHVNGNDGSTWRAPAYTRGVKNHRKTNFNSKIDEEVVKNMKNMGIDPKHFNVNEWRAWHFGENAIIKDAVTQKRKDFFSDSKASNFFKKVNKKKKQKEHMNQMNNNRSRQDIEDDIRKHAAERMEKRRQERKAGGVEVNEEVCNIS